MSRPSRSRTFQYLDEDGNPRAIDSAEVNAYLQGSGRAGVHGEDFRTWAGTVLAALALRELEAFDTQAQAKKNIVRAIERVAERLGNTPSVCRKCYVHPEVIDAYLDGSMLKTLQDRAEEEIRDGLKNLSPDRSGVVAMLQQRLKVD